MSLISVPEEFLAVTSEPEPLNVLVALPSTVSVDVPLMFSILLPSTWMFQFPLT